MNYKALFLTFVPSSQTIKTLFEYVLVYTLVALFYGVCYLVGLLFGVGLFMVDTWLFH